ncbi:hypothetical protein ACFOM8_18640 [Paracoccus angustae]|uniref:Uncharacterized protein n=1 Tax=Paracoccus angustae TaxID=1671480 RepID=A0ABV7U8M0_9RHOB
MSWRKHARPVNQGARNEHGQRFRKSAGGNTRWRSASFRREYDLRGQPVPAPLHRERAPGLATTGKAAADKETGARRAA